MEPSRDEVLFATLESLRPAPSPAFAAELDARAAAGFPRRSREGEKAPQRALARLRSLNPRQLVLAGGGVTLATVAVATAIVASSTSTQVRDTSAHAPATTAASEESGGGTEEAATEPRHLPPELEGELEAAGGSAHGASKAAAPASAASEVAAGERNPEYLASEAPSTTHRDVQRSAQIVLGTEPDKVGDASAKVFAAVHDFGGIVLSSSVNGGSEAGSARFEMLIPSAKLSDAMAAFSGIADVRYRHEGTLDITAPTEGTREMLQDSQARIDSLLEELAEAETETEREVAEARLHSERRHAGALKTSLSRLERRADFSLVRLRIKSDGSESSSAPGGWDVGDAFHDAGNILAVAAGVTIVSLAVLGPIALIVLLAWLASRAWVRQRRERALG